jgi:Na+-transporting methylmalonyl-CoA/oxaloacetate decarboxylase beta subunit
MDFLDFVVDNLEKFLEYTAFANMSWGNLIMIIKGLVFIALAILKN